MFKRVLQSYNNSTARILHIKHNFKSKMSHNKEHAYALLSMRQKKKIKMLTSTNSNITLKVLGSGARGTPASLLVSSDHICYLFNCGEGTQRIAQEHHYKMSKVDNIFVTKPTWQNIGGLPGFVLTLQNIGLSEINVHCPETLHDFMDAVEKFTLFPTIKLCYPPTDELRPYKDQILTIWYVPITKSSERVEQCSMDSGDENQHYSNKNGKRPVNNKDTEDTAINVEKKLKRITDLVCYIGEIHPKRGKLCVRKCQELGITPGPDLRLLKEGKDITKEDGTVVSSANVCAPIGPKVTFMVVECPMEEYLDSFVNHPAFLKYQNSSINGSDEILYIYHITPENIFNSPQYQDWIKKFSSSTEHVILNEENTCMGSESVFKNQYLLNMIHPEIFPLLHEDSLKDEKDTGNCNFHRGRTMQTLKVQPYLEDISKDKITPTPLKYIDEVNLIPDFAISLKELKTTIDTKTLNLNISNIPEYPQIIMLGTGSSVPSKVRNTSAILLRVTKDSSILMDCAESTLSQIIRLYGNSEANNILRSIKAIYVSHMHADHHLGIIGLLQERAKVTQNQLYLLAPRTMEPWLHFYHNQFEPISHYKLIYNNDFYFKNHVINKSYEDMIYDELNLLEINTIYVKHCKFSFGLAVTLGDKTKIVYSGDTMPSDTLIQLGQNCDLLIHEATMDDGLETLAHRKSHCTTSQAINTGKSMNAKFILLTHFSQRYSKIPQLPEGQENVGLAYDHMVIKLPQLPLLPLFYPCLKIMFNEYDKVSEKRASKRIKIENVLFSK